MTKKNIALVSILLVSIGVVGRLAPHLWNATPIAAIALVATAYMGARRSIVIVLAAMAIGDYFLGTYDWRVMAAVYASMAIAALIGIIAKRKAPVRVLAASLASSVSFFLVTNFAVWLFASMYPQTLSGLFESYAMAVPFFKNQILGDLFYSFFFFGSFEAVSRFVQARSYAPRVLDHVKGEA